MKRKMCFRIIFAIMVVGIMVAVFLFSSQSGEESNHLSKGVLEHILTIFHLNTDPAKLDSYNLVLRKIAHFSLYFFLGVGIMGFLLTTPIKINRCLLLSLILCVLFAATDEFHQFLLGSRNGNALDVLLDSMGALVGISTLGIWRKIRFPDLK